MKFFTTVLIIFTVRALSINSITDDNNLRSVLEILLKSDDVAEEHDRRHQQTSDDDDRYRHRRRQMFAVEVDTTDWTTMQHIARSAGIVIEERLQSFENVFIASKRGRRHRRDVAEIIEELIMLKKIRWVEYLRPLYREKRVVFTDPLYEAQLQSWSTLPKMWITEAWEEGYSGKGVTIAILDDGVDSNHDDLRASFDSSISFDFINRRTEVTVDAAETHGTRCAGIIAMTANNSKCGVGVAHGSRIGGLVVLNKNQYLNDAIEGDALAYKTDRIDIYSVSWGPTDDGRTAERPGLLAQKALEHGTIHGRGGLGSIYVWASGNGDLNDDDCAMDGYASNMNTMTFGVATSSGESPWYAEGCSAVMASISESSAMSNGMVTTDVDNKCASFSGSSAAAPLAAAILALALEANPSLTQRDVQHLIVYTSDSNHLVSTSPGHWIRNGAGRLFSRQFGFGVLNALQLTTAAKQWKSVPELARCSRLLTIINGTFTVAAPLVVSLPFHGCRGTSGEVNWIERLQLDVTLEHPRRGLVSILLISPAGTTIELLRTRKNDNSSDGLLQWPFISVAQWSENPQGTWKIEAHTAEHINLDAVGLLKAVTLTVHGTRDDPLRENSFIYHR